MMLKLFGMASIILSSVAASRTLIEQERKRVAQIDSFMAIIRYIRDQIDCYSAPIGRIFAECPRHFFDGLGGYQGEISFGQLLERHEFTVDGEGKRILFEFSDSLGKNYRDRQIRLCDSAIVALEGYRKTKERDLSVKKKAITVLCLALGGITVIALI